MPADHLIDYNAILDKIEEILNLAAATDGQLEGAKILIEEEPAFGLPDYQVAISVFMDNRNAAEAKQMLGAGKRTGYQVRTSFWVTAFGMNNYRETCRIRNAMLSQLESVLMKNRTWENLVDTSWLEGGVMFTARNASNQTFAAAAEVVMTMETSIVNA